MENSLDQDQVLVLLGSDLDLNCLQRLSADDTSRHSHFLLSAGSTHPNIIEKLLTRFNSLPLRNYQHAKSILLCGGKAIIIGSPYQMNTLYQYPLPGKLVCVFIKLVVIK